MKIKIFAVGGTIDKVYFDQKSNYQVGEPQIRNVLAEANVTFEYDIEPLISKDSLDMTDSDRQLIYDRVAADKNRLIVITHGTDTMVATAKRLSSINGKTIVLTGSMQPARFRYSDATFNIGSAMAAVQTLPEGVYITMNGRIFQPDHVRKNVDAGKFEKV